MSDSIYVRVKLNRKFYDVDTSDFLFRIISEGCNRHIAISVVPPESGLIACKPDEAVLSLSDSFNFRLGTPLIGIDIDSEVEEYRPEPLHTRLLNLQQLFQFILKEDVVDGIEVYFTTDYDVEGLETVDVMLDDFASKVKQLIFQKRKFYIGVSFRFVFGKLSQLKL